MATAKSPYTDTHSGFVARPIVELEALDEDNQLKKFRQRAKQGWELVQAFDGYILIGRTFESKERAGEVREQKKAERKKNPGRRPGTKGPKKTNAKKKGK